MTDELAAASDSEISTEELAGMEDYYQLKQALLLTTAGIGIASFGAVWVAYSLDTALNYLIGACFSVVYLRMLSGAVERLGSQRLRLGSSRLALFVGLMVVASQWQQLQVVPIFLGFLTHKAAIILYTLQTTLAPARKQS